jgi:hypothetical protein
VAISFEKRFACPTTRPVAFSSLLSRIALFDGAESAVFDGLRTSASRLL